MEAVKRATHGAAVGLGALLLLCTTAVPADAVTMIIGDPDGFGIEDPNGQGLVRADSSHTNPADTDGDGIIEGGEYLPDWPPANGSCAIGSGDSFDLRSSDEETDTTGAQYTDLAVEGNGSSDGIQFIFEFPIPQPSDVGYGSLHYINFVFGDYDVTPAEIDIDGETVEMELQGSGNDGLVQTAFAPMDWAVVEDGLVTITISAPNEPYLAYDYALLDTSRLADGDGDGIPGSIDNCQSTHNTDQSDVDGDGVGDVCDNCEDTPNTDQIDSDGDGPGDICDLCPYDPHDDQDDDGFCVPDDCDGDDPAVNPDASEICDDGIDNDCDLLTDGDDEECPDVGDDDDDDSGDDDSGGDDDDDDGGDGDGGDLEATLGAGEGWDYDGGCNCRQVVPSAADLSSHGLALAAVLLATGALRRRRS